MVASILPPRASSQTFFAAAGEIDRRLSGRIAGADQRHLLVGAQLAFERRSPIVHARHLELMQVVDLEAPVACTAGEHDRARLDALFPFADAGR